MGFLSLFSKKTVEPEVEPIDFSLVGVDMHSHLLFGIDDGAQTIEDSLMLIGQLKEMGYSKFITTPHIYRDLYFNSPETILPKYEAVKKAIAENNLDVEFQVAAEYFLDEQDLIEKELLLTFGRKNVLFELSFDSEPASIQRAIFNMQLRGYRPILAHPERYPYYHKNLKKYENFVDQDIALQLNINSITGHYGPEIKRVCEKLIDAGMVSYIGTDCHHMGHINLTQQARKNPHLRKLIESGKLKNKQLFPAAH
jgi:tyrosine-protein phosphatase YwqE